MNRQELSEGTRVRATQSFEGEPVFPPPIETDLSLHERVPIAQGREGTIMSWPAPEQGDVTVNYGTQDHECCVSTSLHALELA
ncbi:MAG: hypothetical protein AAB582_03040 [Patescibacteria group bacterium]